MQKRINSHLLQLVLPRFSQAKLSCSRIFSSGRQTLRLSSLNPKKSLCFKRNRMRRIGHIPRKFYSLRPCATGAHWHNSSCLNKTWSWTRSDSIQVVFLMKSPRWFSQVPVASLGRIRTQPKCWFPRRSMSRRVRPCTKSPVRLNFYGRTLDFLCQLILAKSCSKYNSANSSMLRATGQTSWKSRALPGMLWACTNCSRCRIATLHKP